MIKVERHGAFNVNSVGMERLPFPMSFSVREADGSWMIGGAAAQAGELIDVLTRTANDTVVVVNLETNSFLHEDDQQWRPSLIAAEQGVHCTVHPVGALASDSIEIGEEFLLMDRDSLPRFLSGLAPYDLSLVDVPAGVPPSSSMSLLRSSARPPVTSRSFLASTARVSGSPDTTTATWLWNRRIRPCRRRSSAGCWPCWPGPR
ncbi:hypothetical protein ABTX81_27870 [Kitasatospora sp. NPDC097605]|uniref:hypothetical protein n=1 Tax=Kitasatospora sp. NPDC097605 TaxID=3157226 RepID=UPI0033258FA4